MNFLKKMLNLSLVVGTICCTVGLSPLKSKVGFRRIASDQDKILATILSEKKADLEKRQKEIKELRRKQKEVRVQLAGAKSDEHAMVAVQALGYFASATQLLFTGAFHAYDWSEFVSRPKFHYLKRYAAGLTAIVAIKGVASLTEKRVKEITAQLETIDESLAELEEAVKTKINDVSNIECRLLGVCRK